MSSHLAHFFYQDRIKTATLHLNIEAVRTSLDHLILLLFPQRSHHHKKTLEEIEHLVETLKLEFTHYIELVDRLISDESTETSNNDTLTNLTSSSEKINPSEVVETFFKSLPQLAQTLDLDVLAALDGDPAAYSKEEVIVSYPGFYAIVIYRLANNLHQLKVPLLPRLLTEYAHEKTGIDIHPGAQIGPRFFIDHGTGVVIGETAIIGENVKIYQGVTLGALSVKKKLQSIKRHPTIEDGVVIYAGATILGGQTIIGKNSIIGGNTWIVKSVEEKSVITLT